MHRLAPAIYRTNCLVSDLLRTSCHTIAFPRYQQFQPHIRVNRGMSSDVRSSLSHEERTATEPRENEIHDVVLRGIQQASPTVRVLRLLYRNEKRPIKFLPGQWLDVHIPGIPKPGGFTITSTPGDAAPHEHQAHGYVELAIQKSPWNPPAAWLWRPEKEILGSQLSVRVGGSFVWPPPNVSLQDIQKAVFIAGGVGINPLISMISHLHYSKQMPEEVRLLYTSRVSESGETTFLFGNRLRKIAIPLSRPQFRMQFYVTGEREVSLPKKDRIRWRQRRIEHDDLIEAIGRSPVDRAGVVCYVCGPPAMTDDFVSFLRNAEGMDERRVLCEKWW